MSDIQEYPDVVQEVRGALNPGRLKLQRNSIIFKNNKTGKVDQFQSSEVEKCQWLKRARGHCLKLVLKSKNIHRYDGLKEADFDKLNKFCEEFYEMGLEKVDMSYKGWNWGLARFEGNSLNFEVDKNLVFDIPLTNVSHSTAAKNEVTLEFHQNDDAAVNLMELRFHIPNPVNATTDAEKDPEKDDAVQEFYKQVLECADIIQATGDAIVVLSEIQCLTPRGRYDIKLYPSFLQLHGKTFDYKIPYTTILRLFLLPHKDGRQIFFVVSLDPPIKQGQTRYHFLILLFNKEDEMTVEMGISEEDLEQKYEGKLQPEMTGPEYELVSRIFKVITQRKITVPGSFMGHSGTQAISCSYKAATGLLYPLERGFIFVHKPPMHIRFDELSGVNFGRSAGNTRSFDFDVETKSGNVFNFVGIEKDEYGKLYDFVSTKKLRVKNIGGTKEKGNVNYNEAMSGSDDDKGDHDAYMEKMKREGKSRAEDDDDDDDDSSDESFNPGESGSEVAEEYDSNPPTSSGSDSDSDYSAGGGAAGSEDSAEDERRDKEREKRRQQKEQEKREKREKKKPRSAKTVPEGPRKKRKSKKAGKDPDAPKRPMSGYFLWLNANRESIKTDNPGISVTELTKIGGELWRELQDKTEWDAKAKEAKANYEVAMAAYRETLKDKPAKSDSDDDDDDDDGGEKKTKKAKKAPAPRKSPKKAASNKAETSGDFKSKEFISSDETSDEDKPLKKKAKKKEAAPKEEKSSPVASEEEDAASASEKSEAAASDKESDAAASEKSDAPASEKSDAAASDKEEEASAAEESGSD